MNTARAMSLVPPQMQRLLDITHDPDLVSGHFDLAHLKRIHTYLFQDAADEFGVGQFRMPPDNQIEVSAVDHCPPDQPLSGIHYDENHKEGRKVDLILSSARQYLIRSQHDAALFSEKLADLYADLDYQHIFKKGNGLTLRCFTEQLADHHGYDLDWPSLLSDQHASLKLNAALHMHVIERHHPDFASSTMPVDFLMQSDPAKSDCLSLHVRLKHQFGDLTLAQLFTDVLHQKPKSSSTIRFNHTTNGMLNAYVHISDPSSLVSMAQPTIREQLISRTSQIIQAQQKIFHNVRLLVLKHETVDFAQALAKDLSAASHLPVEPTNYSRLHGMLLQEAHQGKIWRTHNKQWRSCQDVDDLILSLEQNVIQLESATSAMSLYLGKSVEEKHLPAHIAHYVLDRLAVDAEALNYQVIDKSVPIMFEQVRNANAIHAIQPSDVMSYLLDNIANQIRSASLAIEVPQRKTTPIEPVNQNDNTPTC